MNIQQANDKSTIWINAFIGSCREENTKMTNFLKIDLPGTNGQDKKNLRTLHRNSSEKSIDPLLTIDTQDTQEVRETCSISQPCRDGLTSKPEYNILRRLPGYSVGDPLRKEDLVLCYSKEATAYAMGKIRPGDCCFILRSDGCYTYALYEGKAKRDTGLLSFQIDEGHFKRVATSKFCKSVKVPALLRGAATKRRFQ